MTIDNYGNIQWIKKAWKKFKSKIRCFCLDTSSGQYGAMHAIVRCGCCMTAGCWDGSVSVTIVYTYVILFTRRNLKQKLLKIFNFYVLPDLIVNIWLTEPIQLLRVCRSFRPLIRWVLIKINFVQMILAFFSQ